MSRCLAALCPIRSRVASRYYYVGAGPKGEASEPQRAAEDADKKLADEVMRRLIAEGFSAEKLIVIPTADPSAPENFIQLVFARGALDENLMPDNTTLLTRSGLDLDVAVFLAEAAAITYSGSISIKAWALANGFGVQCTTFDHDNIQGFWCVAGSMWRYCLSRHEQSGQWLRDARFIPIESEWGRVHAGFKGGIEIAEPDLLAFEKAAVDAKHVGSPVTVSVARWR